MSIRSLPGVLAALSVLTCATHLFAQPPAPKPVNGDPPVRRVFVPVEDLNVVFDRDKEGVILPRAEFLKLYAAATKNTEATPNVPNGIIVSQAEYSARVQDDQLVVTATIQLTQLLAGWQAIALPYRGMSLESATLDDKPAQLGRGVTEDKPLMLLSNQLGRHTLKLELSTNMVTVGSDKVAAFGLRPIPAASLQLTLPAGKHLYVDEAPLERTAPADKLAEYRIAIGGKRDVRLRITERTAQQDAAALVFATHAIGVHVAPEELTWRAVTTLQVYGRPIDRLQFTIPKSLDIVSVESNGLERWEIADGPNASTTLLKLSYREPFRDTRTITFNGVAATVLGQPWSVPPLTLDKATSQTTHVLLQNPPGLRLQVVESTGIRRITAEEASADGMPDLPQGANVAQTWHFAGWQSDFSLLLVVQPKAQELQATIATRLNIGSHELELQSSINVQTRFAPLFTLDLTLPVEWTVVDVLHAGKPIPWRAVPLEAGLHRVQVPFQTPIPADGKVDITLIARLEPSENWPVEETPLLLKLPEVFLPQVGVTDGTYMIAGDDDLDFVPEELKGLDPTRLPAGQQNLKFAPRLVYDYQDTRFTGQLKISRKPVRIAAHTLAFHRLDRETLVSHLEARLAIQGGGLRRVQIALSESAGTNLRFRLIGSPLRIVEQTSEKPANGERVWTLQLDQRAHGLLLLSVDLEAPRATDAKSFNPPRLRVVAAERENGHVAIEAGPEQQLSVNALSAGGLALSEIDPASLPVPLGYVPRERIIAAYHAVLPGYRIALAETRFDRLAVPTAVCDASEIESVVGETGEIQNKAKFSLRAVGVQSLRVKLPGDSSLWATLVDGSPIEVRKLESGTGPTIYSVPLPPASTADAPRTLELYYKSNLPRLKSSGTLQQQPPLLEVVNGQGAAQPLEILQRKWTLHTPPETEIVASTGEFEPAGKLQRPSFLGQLQDGIHIGSSKLLMQKSIAVVLAAGMIAVVVLTYRRRGFIGVALLGLVGTISLILGALLLSSSTHYYASSKSAISHEKNLADATKGETDDEDGPLEFILGPRNQDYSSTVMIAGAGAVESFGGGEGGGGGGGGGGSGRSPGPTDLRGLGMAGEVNGAMLPGMSELGSDLGANSVRGEAGAAVEGLGKDLSDSQTFSSGISKDKRLFKPGEKMKYTLKSGSEKAWNKALSPQQTARSGKEAGTPPPSMYRTQDAFAQPKSAPAAAPPPNAPPGMDKRLAEQVAVNTKLREEIEEKKEADRFDEDEKLEVNRPQPARNNRIDVLNINASPAATAGRLSLSVKLQQPPDYRSRQFVYNGSAPPNHGPELVLDYQDQRSLSFFALVIQIGMLLLSWILRRWSVAVKGTLGIVGLAIPLAFAPIAPLSALPALDGMFLGTLSGMGLWLILGLIARCPCCRTETIITLEPVAKSTAIILIAVGLSFAIGTSECRSQEKPAPAATKPKVAPPTPSGVDDVELPDAVAARRKHTIVVPYDAATDPLKSERVFLPFPKFLELWNQAHPEQHVDGPAPVAGLIAEALYAARVLPGDAKAPAQVEVTGRIVLHSFRDHQIPLPLPFEKASLSSALLDGKPAPITVHETDDDSTGGLVVLVTGKGAHVLDVKFLVPAQRTGPAGKFKLSLMPVPAGALRFTLPDKDLALKVNGASNVFRQIKQQADTVAIVPIAEGGEVNLSWAPARVREAVDGIVHTDAATAVLLDDTGVRINTGFTFTVRQGTLKELTFSLPAGLLVRQIEALDLGGWELAGEGDQRTLKVFLRRDVTDATSLVFDLYWPQTFTDAGSTLKIPQFAPIGVTRETGVVAVYSEKQFTVTPGSLSNLSQIDIGLFAPTLGISRPVTPPLYAYRYAQRPFQLELRVSRLKPQSRAVAEHAVLIAARKMRLGSHLDLHLAGAPRSEIVVQLPPGYLLYDLQTSDAADYYVEKRNADDPKDGPLLHVELAEPRVGDLELLLDGIIPRDPADMTPSVALPYPLGMNELRTSTAIWLEGGYTGTLQELVGWKSVDPDQLSTRLRTIRAVPVQFAFTTTTTIPQPIGIALNRAATRLNADALTSVIVGESAVQYLLSLQWNISLAAENKFVFTTPDWLADKLDFSGNRNGPRVRQIMTDKIDGKRLRWTVLLEEPQTQKYFLTARAVLPPPSAARIEAPQIGFEETVEGEEGPKFQPLPTQKQFVLLVNLSKNQLDSTFALAVEAVPAGDLPIIVSPGISAQAAEIVRVKDNKASLVWNVRSLQQVQSLPASVNLVEMKLVLAHDGSWRGQADFRIANRSRQFLALSMPEGSQVLSLFVQNRPSRPVQTERNGQKVWLIPLPKTVEGDISASVRLVYSGRFEKPLPKGVQVLRTTLDLPAPRVLSQADDADFGIPVARTSWTIYAPPDLDLKPLQDTDRTNVVGSVEGYERAIAEINESLYNLSQLSSSPNSYSGRTRNDNVRNNLKQLGIAVHNAEEFSKQSGKLDKEQQQELRELLDKYRNSQVTRNDNVIRNPVPQIQDDDSRPTEPGVPAQPQVDAQSIEQQLQGTNNFNRDEQSDADQDFDNNFRSNLAVKKREAPAKGKSAGKPQSAASNRRQLRSQTESQALSLNNLNSVQQQAPQASAPNVSTGKMNINTLQRGQSWTEERYGKVPVDDPNAALALKAQEQIDLLKKAIGHDFAIVGNDVNDEAMQLGGMPIVGRMADGIAGGMGGAGPGFAANAGYLDFQAGPATWTSVGGLSLPIDVPQSGRVLTFSKVGGDPKLAVGLRPKASVETGFGLIWLAVWLGISLAFAIALSSESALATIGRNLPPVVAIIGLLWYFLLPGAIFGFLLFLLGAVSLAWQRRRVAA